MNKKKLFTIISIITLFIFIPVLFFFIFIYNTATLDILVAPSDSTVTINDKKYKTKAKIRLRPGNYNIKITKPDFSTYETTLTLDKNQNARLYEYLEPLNDSSYYANNPQESLLSQKIADIKHDLSSKRKDKTNPIWNITPYDNYQQGIKIEAEETNQKILIKAYLYTCNDNNIEKLKQAVLKYLEKHQINLNNYDIEYKNC